MTLFHTGTHLPRWLAAWPRGGEGCGRNRSAPQCPAVLSDRSDSTGSCDTDGAMGVAQTHRHCELGRRQPTATTAHRQARHFCSSGSREWQLPARTPTWLSTAPEDVAHAEVAGLLQRAQREQMLVQLGLRCHKQGQRMRQAGVALREQPLQRPANRARQSKADSRSCDWILNGSAVPSETGKTKQWKRGAGPWATAAPCRSVATHSTLLPLPLLLSSACSSANSGCCRPSMWRLSACRCSMPATVGVKREQHTTHITTPSRQSLHRRAPAAIH